MSRKRKNRLAITPGDINGIGPEVVIKGLSDNRVLNHFTPIIFASSKVLSYYRKLLKVEDFSTFTLSEGQEPNPKRINLVEIDHEPPEIRLGAAHEDAGTFAFKCLEKANEYIEKGWVDAVVTGPINKATIQSDQFNFPGHTEYFGNRFNGTPLMFMIAGDLRVAVVTGHLALKDASSQISREKLEKAIKNIQKSLRQDFAIAKPKIAVLGLNPHAGEEGLLGKEEKEIIKPVIEQCKENGELVFGPFPADGFFGKSTYKKYDAILAMYHDQGLIPFKSLSFGEGVNFTANLKVVRTSPDHGTAYDIAGKGVASESSFRAALYLAHDILNSRADAIINNEAGNNS